MTRFEQIGIDRQYGANNVHEADKLFDKSCDRCCKQGMQLNCDHCNIAFVHSIIIDYFNSKTTTIRN